VEDLRIYDFEFNLLDIEHKLISSNWTIAYNGVGKAEIHLPVSADCTKLLFENKYLFIVQGKKQAIITGKQIGKDCVIYAKTPNWILSRRVLPYFSETEGVTEQLVRSFIENCFSDCDCFVLGNECGDESISVLFEESHNELLCVICEALFNKGLGHRVYLDIQNKKWVFEVIKGVKRELDISESALSGYDAEYSFDMGEYFSDGFYERELTDEEKEALSLPIWEKIVKDDKSGIYRWEKVLYKTQETDAVRELSEKKIIEEISTKTRGLKFGTDYNVGDILNVKFEKGGLKRSLDMRVKEVNIWEEANERGVEPVMEKL